jgi:beta-glucanase (GH16 family)
MALAATLTLAACASTQTGAKGTSETTSPAGFRLVWSDEFEGPRGKGVDAASWTHDLGDGCAAGNCGWGNNEREYYTNDSANVSLTGNGELAIVARIAPPGLSCWYGACRYTSGKIKTQGKVQARPGRVESRLRLPRGQGLWPAFWMLGASFGATPWPQSGEIDIMEYKGSRPNSTSSAIHGPGYSGETPFAHVNPREDRDYSSAFHIFAVEWDSTRVRFFVDGELHYEVARADVEKRGAWVFDQPFFVIFNLAVGGHFDGDPASDAIFPATMLVDWVRVYERTGTR